MQSPLWVDVPRIDLLVTPIAVLHSNTISRRICYSGIGAGRLTWTEKLIFETFKPAHFRGWPIRRRTLLARIGFAYSLDVWGSTALPASAVRMRKH
jgi:hypothetical protein